MMTKELGMLLDFKDNRFLLSRTKFEYRNLIHFIPYGTWDRESRAWEFELRNNYWKNYIIDHIIKFLENAKSIGIEVEVTPAAHKCIEEYRREKERLEKLGMLLDLEGDKFLLSRTKFEQRDMPKSVPYGIWRKETQTWEYDLYSFSESAIIEGMIKLLEKAKSMGVEIEVTPRARKRVEEYRCRKERLETQINAANVIKNGHVPDIPVPLKTKPFEHQKKAFLISSTLDASALLMEQGTGKTLAAIATAGKRFLDGEISKLLVVAPLSVVRVWVNEFKKHADFPYNIRVVEGTLEKKKAVFKQKVIPNVLDVIVVNYDALIQRTKRIAKTVDERKNVEMEKREKVGIETVKYVESGGIGQDILDWKPDMVILDESQRVKNRDAKRSEFVHKLGDLVKYKMILTGTPVTQSPLDLWSQYRFLNKHILDGESFWKFRNKYAIMGGYKDKEVVGYKNLDDLIAKAHSIAYRVTKKEALDLPEFTDQILYCELEPETRKHYNNMRKKMLIELGDIGKVKAQIVLTKLLRLSQITGGFLPVDTGKKTSDGDEVWNVVKIGEEKLKVLKDFIEDFPVDKKLVVFCRFIPEIEEIVKMLRKMNISAESLKGDTKNRDDLITRFQEKNDPRVLVVQIATGGLGITLTRADTAIFYSNSYSFADYEQARARIHRIGQRNMVTYINIIARDTIDEEVLNALEAKKSVADVVVDRIKNGGFI